MAKKNYGELEKHILQFFEYKHLPPHLQEVSKPFCDLAHECVQTLSGLEVIAGLRRLLEAKDCFVRAKLTAPVESGE